jgi:hypothetical protein
MKFIVMHKVDDHMEAAGPVKQEIVQQMGRLVGEGLKSGLFLDGAGLHRSAVRARVRFTSGKSTVTRGPYKGENELVAAFAMVRTSGMDEAIEIAHRYGAILGDGEVEVGPVVEAWDLMGKPRPANVVGERFLLLRKSDAASEAGTPPRAQAQLDRLSDELQQAGVLLSEAKLRPSRSGARLAAGPKDKRSWVDGPFAESKELIAGFSIIEVPSKADALAWANRYAAILDGNEVDVLPVD